MQGTDHSPLPGIRGRTGRRSRNNRYPDQEPEADQIVSELQLPRAALISSDSQFVSQVKQLLSGPQRPVTLELEITSPLYQFGEQQAQELSTVAPELIILDLEESQDLGIQLAQYLVDLNPRQLFIATGPVLSS